MKLNLTKGILISLLAFVIGVVGLIVCLTPGRTAPDKAVAGYIDAINKGDMEKMSKYMMTASDVLGSMGGNLGSELDSLLGSTGTAQQAVPGNEIYSALASSGLRARNRLPEGVTQVTAVELCGCVDGETQAMMNMAAVEVTAVVKVTYVDAEGAEKSFYSNEYLGLIKGNDGYKIADT